MEYAGRDVMRLWDRFETVYVGASLDASGKRGEYLRKGQRWERVGENRKRMQEVGPRVRFRIDAVLSAMNSLHFPDFHREWFEKGYVGPDGVYLHLLRRPEEYRIQVLPKPIKELVFEKYRRHLEEVVVPGGEMALKVKRHMETAMNYMSARDLSPSLHRFRSATKRLDRLRGEHFADVFPELASLMEP